MSIGDLKKMATCPKKNGGKRKRLPARTTRDEEYFLVKFDEDGVYWVADKVDVEENGGQHAAPYYGTMYSCTIVEKSRDKDSLLKRMRNMPEGSNPREKDVPKRQRNDKEMAEKERIMLNREDRVKKQKREMAERNRKLAELVAAMEEEEEEMEEEEEEREVDVVPEPQPGPELNRKGHPCQAAKEPRKKECSSCQSRLQELGMQRVELETLKKRCSVLAAEVEAYKEQLKSAEATLPPTSPPPPVILPQAAHPCARPKCGYVCAEEAAKFNMQELEPGSSIYIYKAHVAEAQGKPSGVAAARFLLGCFFKHKELTGYSMAEGETKEGLVSLDTNLTDSIIKFCIAHHGSKRTEIKRALASKITAARCKYGK